MIISITEPYYIIVSYILATLVGLCVGSFLNVVIYRVPLGMNLAKPASHCTSCGYQLRWYDNIPVVSYCILGGKCRKCKEHISFRYTAVELANMILWFFMMYSFKSNLIYACLAMIISSIAICIFFIDIEHMIIPDRFQIILGVIGVLTIFFDGSNMKNWASHIIGAALAALVFIGLSLIMGKILGREAMGGGDVKLAIVSGLILGWKNLIFMVLLASITGSIYMIIRRKIDGESREIAFGPFLSAALVVAVLFGDVVTNWYFGLLV